MKNWTAKLKSLFRNDDGDSIAEFGPALVVLLVALFFPMINLLSLGLSYALCMVLNYSQVHEASLVPYTEATSATGAIIKVIPDQWLGGMGKFVKTNAPPQTEVSYRGDPKDENDRTVIVSTTVTCYPFLPVPLPIVDIPGLNGPVTFNICSERPVENPDNAPVTGTLDDNDTKGTVNLHGGGTGPVVDTGGDDKGTVDIHGPLDGPFLGGCTRH
jgi:hypothetical protein